MMVVIHWVTVFLILLIIASTLFFYLVNGIASTPSSQTTTQKLENCLPEVIQGDIVEAGAGWGGMTLWFAKKYPKNRVIALENAWCPFFILWLRVRLSKSKNIKVCYGDFTHHSLTSAGLLYTFLCRKGMRKVEAWINRDNPSSLLLASSAFTLPGHTPDKIEKTEQVCASELFFYYIH